MRILGVSQDMSVTHCTFIYPESDQVYTLNAPIEVNLVDSTVSNCLFIVNCPANLQPKAFITINGNKGLLTNSRFEVNIVEPEPEPTLYTESKDQQTRMIDK